MDFNVRISAYNKTHGKQFVVSFSFIFIFCFQTAYLYKNGRGDKMIDYADEQELYEDYDEIPQDEEFTPKKKITIGKQLLIIIQLIICGIALLFMLVMKLIGGDFCNGIINWYEIKYYDSVYISDSNNNLSIFGINNNSAEESSAESK